MHGPLFFSFSQNKLLHINSKTLTALYHHMNGILDFIHVIDILLHFLHLCAVVSPYGVRLFFYP